MSSASKKVIHSPLAAFIPAFLAEDTPPLTLSIILILESFIPFITSKLLSLEPSFTKINSKSAHSCSRMEAVVLLINSSLLYTGTIIENLGIT